MQRTTRTLPRFAMIFGIVFLVVGAAGVIPGLKTSHAHPDVTVASGLGLELGLVPVNVLLNVVHVLFGAWGLAAARSVDGAGGYARAVAVLYAILAVMGRIPALNLHTTFGLIPLSGHDIWLHVALSAVAGYFGFVHRQNASTRVA